mmetsp:Transcript_3778/g.23827  ORF Transcript_3778/g.23827 Transcript_3778/m.23827 type:complete len:321 (-) Transcript_3778:1098-2060(-)
MVGHAIRGGLRAQFFLAGSILCCFVFVIKIIVHGSTTNISSHSGFIHIPRRSGSGSHGLQQGNISVFVHEAPLIQAALPLHWAFLFGRLSIAHGHDAGRMSGDQAGGHTHVRASNMHGTVQERLVGSVAAQKASHRGLEPLGCAPAWSMPHAEGVPCIFAEHLCARFSEMSVELFGLHSCTHRQGQQSSRGIAHHHVEQIPERSSACARQFLQHLHGHQSTYASAVQGKHADRCFTRGPARSLPSQPGQDLGGGTVASSPLFQVRTARCTHRGGSGGLVGMELHVHLARFRHLSHALQGLVSRHRIRRDGQHGVVVGIGT